MKIERKYVEDDPNEERARLAKKVLTVVMGVPLAVLLVFLALPTFRFGGYRRNTVENYAIIAAALIHYASDYDDRLPHEFSTHEDLETYLADYVTVKGAFSTHNPNGGEMVPNAGLAGAELSALDSLDETVMLYDSRDWGTDAGRVRAYVSGGTEYASGFDAQADLRVEFVQLLPDARSPGANPE